ncbi:hypothetical protein PoB_003960600 [Plakobranchus ocellatus]|uniref:Uncharacterized protein n=1 Tax=Plakobranchus ocellatus TaxID=259542 RepID=A0AAV4AXY1_9GAST|nr:hypothetical protein PoB_003960600 [Plakobranchus ocellatus]
MMVMIKATTDRNKRDDDGKESTAMMVLVMITAMIVMNTRLVAMNTTFIAMSTAMMVMYTAMMTMIMAMRIMSMGMMIMRTVMIAKSTYRPSFLFSTGSLSVSVSEVTLHSRSALKTDDPSFKRVAFEQSRRAKNRLQLQPSLPV